MEPYRPNEPFIKLKLDGSLLDRMVEYGIPFTRAIQYFRDNPEGSALETLKLAAEDVVPFYGNYRNNGDLSDYAKEAVMLGVPVKAPGQRGLIRVPERKINVDPERTAIANQQLHTFADRIRDVMPEQAAYAEEIANAVGPVPWNDHAPVMFDDLDLAKDVVFGNTDNYKGIVNNEIRPGEVNWGPARSMPDARHISDAMVHGYTNTPRLFIKSLKDAYVNAGGTPETFSKGLAEFYSPEPYSNRPVSTARRIVESGEPYNFTLRELEQIPRDRVVNELVQRDVGFGSTPTFDSYFNRLTEINPEAAERVGILIRDYKRVLSDRQMSIEDKVPLLDEIENNLNREFDNIPPIEGFEE